VILPRHLEMGFGRVPRLPSSVVWTRARRATGWRAAALFLIGAVIRRGWRWSRYRPARVRGQDLDPGLVWSCWPVGLMRDPDRGRPLRLRHKAHRVTRPQPALRYSRDYRSLRRWGPITCRRTWILAGLETVAASGGRGWAHVPPDADGDGVDDSRGDAISPVVQPTLPGTR